MRCMVCSSVDPNLCIYPSSNPPLAGCIRNFPGVTPNVKTDDTPALADVRHVEIDGVIIVGPPS